MLAQRRRRWPTLNQRWPIFSYTLWIVRGINYPGDMSAICISTCRFPGVSRRILSIHDIAVFVFVCETRPYLAVFVGWYSKSGDTQSVYSKCEALQYDWAILGDTVKPHRVWSQIFLLLLKAFILRLISIDSKAHSSQNNTHLITVCYYRQSGTSMF